MAQEEDPICIVEEEDIASEEEQQAEPEAAPTTAPNVSLDRSSTFNDYYFTFLKRVKGYAKAKKTTSKPARDILRSLKAHYNAFDRADDTIMPTYVSRMAPWYAAFLTDTPTDDSCLMYAGISVTQLRDVSPDVYVFHYYMILFYLLTRYDVPLVEMVDLARSVHQPNYAEKVKTFKAAAGDDTEGCKITLQLMERMRASFVKSTTMDPNDALKGIEDTTIGRLAKEIMGDLDMDELQKSLGSSGNLMDAFQNPTESGLGDLIGKVSTKMLSKLSSGEISQEALLSDAMNMLTKLPGMFGAAGGAGANNPFAGMADLMKNMGPLMEQFGMGASSGGPGRKRASARSVKRKLQKK